MPRCKVLFLILMSFLSAAIAQTQDAPPPSRFEAGMGFSYFRSGQFGQVLNYKGVEARFLYNLNPSFSLDSAIRFYPTDFRRFNEINVQQGGRAFIAEFGLRGGIRKHMIGILGFARPGIVRFDRVGELNSLATRPRTSFLTDIGGSLELYPSKRTIVFLEVGSPLIMFGERTKPLGNGAVAIAPGTVEGGLQISTGLRLRLGEVAREPSGATPQVRRYELGLLFSSLSLQRFFDTLKHEPGIGVRGSYNLTNHLSLDTEVDYFPRNPHAVSPQEGGKMLLAVFGAKVGVRKRRAGFFAKARPGFLRYSQTLSDNSAILNPRYSPLSHFVLDAGGVFEVYPSQRTLVRFDVGDTIIWYGQRNVPGFLSPFPAFTRDTLQLSTGFAFRF